MVIGELFAAVLQISAKQRWECTPGHPLSQLSYHLELQSAVIAISWGLTAALPCSWDKVCPYKHHKGNVEESIVSYKVSVPAYVTFSIHVLGSEE